MIFNKRLRNNKFEQNQFINKKNIIILLLFLLGILLRLLYLFQYSKSPLFFYVTGPDVEEYNQWANLILQGNFIWKEVSIHSPLYPYYLALLKLITGDNIFFIRFLQLFIGMVGFIILFNSIYNLEMKQEKLRKILAYGYLILAMFFTPLFFYQGEIISEALLIPLVCCVIASLFAAEKTKGFDRITFFLISGIFSGMAVITHPLSIFFVFAEVVYFFFNYLYKITKNKFYLPFDLAIFLVPVLIMVLGISIYNSILSGRFIFIQKNSGYNLFLGNNANANGMCNVSAGPEWVEVHRKAELAAKKMGITRSEYFYNRVWEYIKNKPLHWSKLLCTKALLFWNCKDIYSSLDPIAVKYFTALMRFSRYFFGMLSVLALFGVVLIFKKVQNLADLRHFLILIISIWIGLTFTVVSDRYRIIVLPGFFIMAVYGFSEFFCGLRKLNEVLISIILFIAAVVFVYWPVYKINYGKDKAFADSMYGEAYYQAGDFTKAKICLENALKVFPKWDRCYTDLGIMEMQINPKAAIKYFRKAYELVPSSSAPLLNTGLAYNLLGEYRRAQKYFKAAFEVDKNNNEVIYNYAYSLFNTGECNKALYILEYAEKQNCSSAKTRNLRGVIYLNKNLPERALIYFKQAVFYDSNKVEYKLNLAVCFLALKENGKSGKILNKILNQNPENKIALALKKKLADMD